METSMRLSRRTFIAWAGGAGAGFYLFGRLPGMSAPIALAQIPGGSLDPKLIPKYTTPLLVPPVMPRAGTLTDPGGKPVDYYEISMRQLDQQILPSGMPTTTVWGYGAVTTQSKKGLMHPQRPVAHDRGKVEAAGPGQVDQRARGRGRAASCPTCCRSIRRCTGRTRPAGRWDATCGRRSRRRPARTRARCRS